jgi:thiamine biosynthesis lipoprotein
MQYLHLEPEGRRVSFERAGLEINLGSIGKGYAVDRATRLLRREGNVEHALIHGGHSSVHAMGHEPGSRRGWSIGLLDPENAQRRLAVLRLHNRALGVSAASYQHFVHEGRKLGHILDPRTAWPAEGVRLAAVTAPTATEADALATAFFILGMDAARAYCEAHPQIGAALLPAAADARLEVLGRMGGEMEAVC